MDISLTPTNVHVNTYIPDDIIVFSILSKLSLKSLKRFACVRKSWSGLFNDPTFMTMYSKSFLTKGQSYYDDKSLLLYMIVDGEDKYSLYSLSGERFENRFKLDWRKCFLENQDDQLPVSWFEILGFVSINGTICLRGGCNGVKKIILWNPTTNEFKVIPSSFCEHGNCLSHFSYNHLVGYDRVRDDYKVIQFTECTPCNPKDFSKNFWEIYSLRSNSWRKIDVNMPNTYRYIEQVYMDGVTHECWGKRGRQSFLGSFDFSRESFVRTPLPSYVDDCFDIAWKHLVILNGSIAFILNYKKTSTFDILILGEVGVKKSWTKLFTVGALPACLAYPFIAGNKGKILFGRKDGELVWFDLNTGMIDEIGVKATKYSCMMLFHKECILPIGGIYN
ncbi:F-box/kelch-repeat protein At3g06240-like [Trifolium pratense]|uniref:F-box/kelch-repeat protein At3g06240-like n=1 Tax=Trifolium pratense TaxID=57577 RepID=UPI001E68FDAE|nr:F-box/kelch-repeat protein At3g06240-like [Trifolium pratense]